MLIYQAGSFKRPQLQNIKASLQQQKNHQIGSMVLEIRKNLPLQKQRIMDLIMDFLGEKGSSLWLTA